MKRTYIVAAVVIAMVGAYVSCTFVEPAKEWRIPSSPKSSGIEP